jgi:hypothetical protein
MYGVSCIARLGCSSAILKVMANELVSYSKHSPPSLAAHNLIDRLSALIGQTDLLMEKTPEDSAAMKHALAIRAIAKGLVDEAARFQFDFARKVAK